MPDNPTNTETTDSVKRFSIRRYAANWAIIALVLILGLSAGLGWNTVTKSFDLFEGLGTLSDLFGGLTSFGALLLALAVTGIVVYGLYYMSKTNYDDDEGRRWLHIGLGVVFIVFVAWLGLTWIHLPSGLGWMSLVFLAIPTGLAFRGAGSIRSFSRVRQSRRTTPVLALDD
ncbi:MAG TPA: hypothetical protein VFH06_02525 [Candidatus Saccharimonadales bacterium]|nr:hypothetical protein [Candidatus Saccharimonadales bacterium]